MSNNVLALDLGPTSIGWALVDEVHQHIVAAGVRVFPEGVDRDKQDREVPKNQARRVARGMRRQIARRAKRKRILRKALVEVGLLPKCSALKWDDPERRAWEDAEFKKADPYELRARALKERLEPHELGRVFLHLNQRRGFLSNRKIDRGKNKKEKTEGMLAEISQLQQRIDQSQRRFLGAYLDECLESKPLQRIRGQHTRREMLLQEFDAIWAEQQKYYPKLLTDTLKYGASGRSPYPRPPIRSGGGWQKLLREFGIHGLIFFQRPIYWPKSVVGRCELDPKQKRCRRADRAAQEFRLLQEVNNLRIIAGDGEVKELTETQRAELIALLSEKESVDFDAIRKKLGLSKNDGFNLEAGKRSKLDGMKTDAVIGSKKCLGKSWYLRPEEEKNAIVRCLINDDEATFRRRASDEWKLTNEQVEKLLDVDLPEGYASYGLDTIEKLLPYLRQGLMLSSADGRPCAIREAGYLRPWERPGKHSNLLPEPPELTNPIVRQALFEVRKLVNAIVREYGKPKAVHIELAREVKGTAEQRRRMTEEMREREKRRSEAAERIKESGYKPTRDAIDRYLLWQEQDCKCMYSGKTICINELLGGEVQMDHILPYSKSLDDSLMNRVVCFRNENAEKGQRTVYQWLAETNPDKYEQILERAARLPIEVRNRKRPKFSQKTCELEQFINRQLTDTSYITSMVVEYVRCLGVDVLGSKGQLTADLRYDWGLNTILREDGRNSKNRADHRHHAIDAIVIALTNRKRLQLLANRRPAESLPLPWDSLRSDVERIVKYMNVSHRASRRIAGALHEETIYGPTQKKLNGEKKNRPWAKDWIEQEKVYVLRKSLENLSLNEVSKIRDVRIRELVEQRLAEYGLKAGRQKSDGSDDDNAGATKSIPKKVWENPLILWPRKGRKGSPGTIIRKVRLIKPEESIVPLGTRGQKYVKPGSLHHVAIFETIDPSGKTKRIAVFVSMLEAAQRVRERQPVIQRRHPSIPDAKFVMSLSRGQMVQGIFKRKEKLVRFWTAASTTGQLWFLEHTDARKSGDATKLTATATTLNGKKVCVDILGRIRRASD